MLQQHRTSSFVDGGAVVSFGGAFFFFGCASLAALFLLFLGAPPRSLSLQYTTTRGAVTTSSSLYVRDSAGHVS
jgi:hypothetical protein